ncbi:MAG: Holliday junction resolvase RuvX [Planctomycetota bacterium]
MTVLGVDFGWKRIGLAFSDRGDGIAFAGRVLTGTPDEAVDRIVDEARERNAETIVVGLPRNMNGTWGEMAEQATAFADRLRRATDAEVLTWDERLTSVQADRAMLRADLSRAKRKKRIDALAAQLMLQNYLDSRRISSPGPPGETDATERDDV